MIPTIYINRDTHLAKNIHDTRLINLMYMNNFILYYCSILIVSLRFIGESFNRFKVVK